MVNKRGRSHLKYAGQPNLEGPILAPNGNRSKVYKYTAYLGYFGAKAKGALLYLHLR